MCVQGGGYYSQWHDLCDVAVDPLLEGGKSLFEMLSCLNSPDCGNVLTYTVPENQLKVDQNIAKSWEVYCLCYCAVLMEVQR